MVLEIRPCELKTAQTFVGINHRHNKPPIGHKFSIACYEDDRLCGVAMVGRPIARKLDDGLTLEITRNCTDGTHNACSMLYGACCRAAKALGYKRIITYTLKSEPGTSLKASNWKISEENVGGGTWDVPSRRRELNQLTLFGEEVKYSTEKKVRWIKDL